MPAKDKNVPTDSRDVLNGTNGNDTISGLGGNDVINGGNGDDWISGDDGDDKLHGAAGNDFLFGGRGNDQLVGAAGNDWLEGGAGADQMNGGGGADTYAFNFVVEHTTGVVTFGKSPLDYDAPTGGGKNVVPADGMVSEAEFSKFTHDYRAWLDEHAPADYSYSIAQADPVTSLADPGAVDGAVSSVVLTNGQTRYWEGSIEVGGGFKITQSDGHDTLAQFQRAPKNGDTLYLKGLAGLTGEQLDTLFDLTTSDTNGDGKLDTVLSWEGGSITILGTSAWGNDVNAFFTSSQIVLG